MENASLSERIQSLASEKCVPCVDAEPFAVRDASERVKDLPGWVLRSASIQKEFRFRSYLEGLDFACSLGRIAELENHHPELFIGWRRVRVDWSTHVIKGLSRNDFIMAAKSEVEYVRQGHDPR